MRKIVGQIQTDRNGSQSEFELFVEDDATDEQIEAEAKQEAFNLIEWHWREVRNDTDAVDDHG